MNAQAPITAPGAPLPVTTPLVDKIQRVFDPAKFLSNADGTPKLNKWGCFVPRGGRKPKTPSVAPETASTSAAPHSPKIPPMSADANAPTDAPPPPPPAGDAGASPRAESSDDRQHANPPPPPPPDFADVKAAAGAAEDNADGNATRLEHVETLPPDEYVAAAAATVSMVTTAGILVCGAHVAPTRDQAIAMVKAYADCYRAYGLAPKSPPWLGPVIATGVWIGPHLADTRTQSNLQTWKGRVVSWWLKFRGWLDSRRAAATAKSAEGVKS